MTDTQATIADKVRKLLKLAANNPSAEEAAAAAAKAQNLIDTYQLSRLMLDEPSATDAHPDEPIRNFGWAAALDTSTRYATWKGRLASYIARANACRIYQSGSRIAIIGRPSDVETVRYLYEMLAHMTDAAAERHGHGMGRTWRNNFRLGCVQAIGERLREQRKALEQHVRASAGESSTALVRVESALAKFEERRTSVDVWTKANVKLYRMGARRSAYDGSAREAGRKVGRTFPLSPSAGRLHA